MTNRKILVSRSEIWVATLFYIYRKSSNKWAKALISNLGEDGGTYSMGALIQFFPNRGLDLHHSNKIIRTSFLVVTGTSCF